MNSDWWLIGWHWILKMTAGCHVELHWLVPVFSTEYLVPVHCFDLVPV